MNSRNNYWVLFLSVMALMLGGCNFSGSSDSPNGPETIGEGSAKVYLPSLDVGALSKAALDTIPPSLQGPYFFELTIDGEGMFPITKSWPLDTLVNGPLKINRIPAGPERVFTGKLLSNSNEVIQMGADTVEIIPDQSSQVILNLKYVKVGETDVCVTFEGSDDECTAVSPTGYPPNTGEWNVTIFGIDHSTYPPPHGRMELNSFTSRPSGTGQLFFNSNLVNDFGINEIYHLKEINFNFGVTEFVFRNTNFSPEPRVTLIISEFSPTFFIGKINTENPNVPAFSYMEVTFVP